MREVLGRAVIGLRGEAPRSSEGDFEAELKGFATAIESRDGIRLLLLDTEVDALWLAERLASRSVGRTSSRGGESLAVVVSGGRVVNRAGTLVGRPVDDCFRLLAEAGPGQVLATGSICAVEMPGMRSERAELNGAAVGSASPVYALSWPDAETRSVRLPRLLAATEREAGFVGRQADLRALERAWESTLGSGRRLVAYVAGEPGVGKTRLLARLASSLGRRGATVLYGRCLEDSRMSFGPIAEALATPGASQPAWSGQGELAVHAEVAARLADAAADAPLLLLVDDLHWADRETIQLMVHLLDSAAPIEGLAVCAYRDSEIEEGGLLGLSIQRVRRMPETVHRTLAGLELDELVGLAETVLDRSIVEADEVLLRSVYTESGGNPLFAKELLRALSESGAFDGTAPRSRKARGTEVSASVTETIRQRVERLGPDAGEVLTTAAICGTEFEIALVGAAMGYEPERLAEALGAAERAGLLVDRGDGVVGFSHAVVARALAERSGATERGRIHRAIAMALEARSPDQGDAEIEALAHHWLAAVPGDRDRTIGYCSRAGDSALASFRSEAALRFYGAALELYGDREDLQQCDLLMGLGMAQRERGDGKFRETLLAAARLADRLGDDERLCAAVLANHRGFASASGEVDPERIAMLKAAASKLDDRAEEYPLVLSTLAAELAFSGERRRFDLSDEALAAARALGSDETLASVLVSRFVPIWIPETLEERLANAAEAVELADRLGDPLLQFRAVHWRSVALMQAGDIARARTMITRQDELADLYGDPTSRWIARYDRGNLAIIEGRLGEADRLATQAFELGSASSQPDAASFYGSQLGNIRYEQGRLGELQELLAQVVSQNPGIPAFRSVLALACTEGELRDEARALLAGDAASGFETFPRDVTWLAGHTIYAHVCAELGDAEVASILFDRLEPFAGQIVYTGISAWGVVDHALGRLAALLGRPEADAMLSGSCARYEQLGAPVWQARARLDFARVKLASSDGDARDEAFAMLDLAIEGAESHGSETTRRRAVAVRENARAGAIYAGMSRRETGPIRLNRAPSPATEAGPRLCQKGDIWHVTHGGRDTLIRDSVGMVYLSELLAHPDIELHAVDLQAGAHSRAGGDTAPAGGFSVGRVGAEDCGSAIDAQAKRAYRARIDELREEVEEAERFNDPERAAVAREELDALAGELMAAVGMGGRDRKLSSGAERARVNVTRAVRRTIAKLGESEPELASELDRSIRTGIFCAYEPSQGRAKWVVERSVGE